MNPQMYIDAANVVTKLKMYPYFDVVHYIMMSIAVREDSTVTTTGTTTNSCSTLPHQRTSPPPAGSGGSAALFSRRHPLSSWFSSMMLCFAGSIIANFLLGEPVITPFKDHRNIATATAVWYLVNYSPFDLVYKLCKFLPFYLVICTMREIRRAHMVYHGVLVARKLYPNAYLVIVLVGTIKGCGSCFMKHMDRLVRGTWMPGSNEILQPTFVTKASLFASVIFLCERLQMISAPHPVIHFGIVMFFVYFSISSVLLGLHDPFVPLENLFCGIFMGGFAEALRQARTGEPVKEDDSTNVNSDVRSTEAKKKD